jgi:hypothetical protein
MWAPPTDANGYSSLQNLPTPDAYQGTRGGPQDPEKRRAGGHSVSLEDVTHALLPTPRSTDGPKGGPGQVNGRGVVDSLPAIAALLPTPRVSMANGPSQAEIDAEDPNCRLETAVALLPTPRSQNGEDRNNRIRARPLDEPQNPENALARLPL